MKNKLGSITFNYLYSNRHRTSYDMKNINDVKKYISDHIIFINDEDILFKILNIVCEKEW
jgi:hypothetical protein